MSQSGILLHFPEKMSWPDKEVVGRFVVKKTKVSTNVDFRMKNSTKLFKGTFNVPAGLGYLGAIRDVSGVSVGEAWRISHLSKLALSAENPGATALVAEEPTRKVKILAENNVKSIELKAAAINKLLHSFSTEEPSLDKETVYSNLKVFGRKMRSSVIRDYCDEFPEKSGKLVLKEEFRPRFEEDDEDLHMSSVMESLMDLDNLPSKPKSYGSEIRFRSSELALVQFPTELLKNDTFNTSGSVYIGQLPRQYLLVQHKSKKLYDLYPVTSIYEKQEKERKIEPSPSKKPRLDTQMQSCV